MLFIFNTWRLRKAEFYKAIFVVETIDPIAMQITYESIVEKCETIEPFFKDEPLVGMLLDKKELWAHV